jgi:predicted metal-binding protein
MYNFSIICPICGQDTTHAFIQSESDFERYGIQGRIIKGSCGHCDGSFAIEQFKTLSGDWITTRYCRYVLMPQAWHYVADVPVSPVMMGNIDEKLEELVGTNNG